MAKSTISIGSRGGKGSRSKGILDMLNFSAMMDFNVPRAARARSAKWIKQRRCKTVVASCALTRTGKLKKASCRRRHK